MELPQPRPFGAPQGSKPTHDFLSLYSPPAAQPQHHHQDPTTAPAPTTTTTSGNYLKTHDFLQPLERAGKNNNNTVAREGNRVEVTSSAEKSLPAPPTEHILPGGIGTYTISHVSYINQTQNLAKPQGNMITAALSSSSDKNDENSNCSSYTGSGFTLWEESAAIVNKGKTGKENIIAGNRHVVREGSKMGGGGMPWTTLMARPSHSSSAHNQHNATISSLSSSHPSPALKNQSFVDMLKSAKSSHKDEDDDGEEFVIKKEPSSHQKGVLSVKIDTVNPDQKPSTPRSKHSATEQRRRSKINDRFSMLRELIPHGDQKRDKASFLLEVIEYIQFLQEKVHKYEDSYRGWNNGPAPKNASWSNSQRPSEAFVDQSRVLNGIPGPALVFAPKLEENTSSIPPNIPRNGQSILDSDMTSLDTIKEICQHPRLTNKVPPPFSVALQPNMCTSGCGSTSAGNVLPSRPASDPVNTSSHTQPQLWPNRLCTTDCTISSDKLKDQELTIESGTISVSTMYSQGLLNTLTQALQSSGVDLSQASISVQIDLGKRANAASRLNSSSPVKKDEAPPMNEAPVSSRLARSRDEESDRTFKRFKTSKD